MAKEIKNLLLVLTLVVSGIFFVNQKADAAVTVINVNKSASGLSGPVSLPFAVPDGYTSVKILDGGIDDRGPVKINGTDVFFACSNGASGCPESNGYWVLPSTSCVAANQVPKPFDITSLVHSGSNTLEVNIDNCGAYIGGVSFNIEITFTCPSLGPLGGLVPCGRLIDNEDTIWNETESCKLCHIIPLISGVMNYILGLTGLLSLLFIIVGSFLSYSSLGGAENLTNVKRATTKTLQGFAIVFVSWAMINLMMSLFGFIDPLGDGSWKKIDCDLNTVYSYCGDGIVNGGEECEPGITPDKNCTTTFSDGLPSYCGSIPVLGKKSCNSCCQWGDCIAGPPALDEDKYGYDVCSAGNKSLNGYACCELYDCTGDQCCGGSNGSSFTIPPPPDFVERNSIPFSSGYCKLGQSSTTPANWYIGTSHTNASFRCWK